MTKQADSVTHALRLIFEGIELLQRTCKDGRKFTIDGRLVGDIGELVAAREFDIILDKKSRKDHDAVTRDGRDVQIKATFQSSLTFGRVGDLYLGLKLSRNGEHEVVFNGPANVIANHFSHRKGFSEKLLSFPIVQLKKLSETISDEDRVPLRVILSSGGDLRS